MSQEAGGGHGPIRRSARARSSSSAPVGATLVCSHCGHLVSYVQFWREHYVHWDTEYAMWNEVSGGQSAEPVANESGTGILREFQRRRSMQLTAFTIREESLLMMRFEAAQAVAAGEDIDIGVGQALRRALGPPTTDVNNGGGDAHMHEPMGDLQEDAIAGHDHEHEEGKAAGPSPQGNNAFWFALRWWGALFHIPGIALSALLTVLAVFLVLPALVDGHGDGPPTVRRIDRLLNLPSISGNETFDQMVVCRGCHTVYHSDECFETTIDFDNNRRRVYRIHRCTRVVYKNDIGRRCNEPLADMVGGRPAVTSRVFPYLSIEGQMRVILSRPDIVAAGDTWRARGHVEGFRSDVYDGDIWREFMDYEGEAFLAGNGVALLLNTDGFQVATTRNYTVDAIYLAILSLPRDLRYRRENMILVGLVPGGMESKGLQQFAKPMVDELLRLWEPDNSLGRRVAVLMIACDVPAARKLGGFSGCAAKTEGPRRECHYPACAPGDQRTFFGGRTDPASGGVVGARPFDTPFPVRTGE
jgi:hypothetical protein